jgi:hypothetical protein
MRTKASFSANLQCLFSVSGGPRIRKSTRGTLCVPRRTDYVANMTETPANQPKLEIRIIPVTPLQQNTSMIWSTETMEGVFHRSGR